MGTLGRHTLWLCLEALIHMKTKADINMMVDYVPNHEELDGADEVREAFHKLLDTAIEEVRVAI